MRNIKTTLRFVRNSALLFAAASGMAYLTGCQETDITPDNGGGNNGDENVLVEALGVTAGTNPGLATTFPNSHMTGTRAANGVLEMKTIPSLPSQEELNKMNVVTDPETNWYNLNYYFPNYTGKPDFYVKGDITLQSLQSQPFNACARFFIDGEVKITGTGSDTELEIYILPGGKLIDGSVIQSKTTIYLYDGGDILQAGTEGVIDMGGTLIAEGKLAHDDIDIVVGGKIYTSAKLHGKSVKLNGGEVYAGCAVTAKNIIYFTGNNSTMKVGYVSAPKIELAGNSPLSIILRDGGYLEATNSLEIKDVFSWGSDGKYPSIVIKADKDEEGAAGYAMVETKTLLCNEYELQGTFFDVAIKYEKEDGNKASSFMFNNSNKINKDVDLVVEVDETGDCAAKWVHGPDGDTDDNNPNKPGNKPEKPTPTVEPELENIGSVAPSGDHTHPISATCVSTYGDKAYLSWHTQGTNFHGCVEYLSVANGKVDLKAYLETAPSNDEYGAIDFNHVLFDNGKIFVAGDHPKKGGILGWIECNDGEFVTGDATLYMRGLYEQKYEKEGQDPKYVNSGSGNCIIRNGNYYQVASIKGFETFNVGDFESTKYIITDENGQMKFAAPKSVAKLGSWTFDPSLSADPTTFDSPRDGTRTGKHIAIDKANSKVVMLTLINRNNSSNTANASIKVYAASDVNYANPIASGVITDQLLSPVDGKDVIAVEGNDIWVCLGNGGVKHMRINGQNIEEVASFVLKDKSQEELKAWSMTPKEAASYCANGLAVGTDYVYVAHGGAGLVVLNKDDLSFVTRTRYQGGKSANYVSLSGDEEYIYVAYGQSNLQIYGWRNR